MADQPSARPDHQSRLHLDFLRLVARCDTGAMSDVVSTLTTFVLIGGLVWMVFKLEPHWASKDGKRMIARIQPLGQHDEPEGRWREMRVFIDGNIIALSTRGIGSSGLRGTYRAKGKSPEPPRRREIYILQGEYRVLLRVPSNSRAVPVLDGLLN